MPKIFSEKDREIIHNKLLEIGQECLKRKSYRDISLDDVTAKAGIAKGTFYNFFSSKELYFYEIMQKIKEDNRRELRELTAGGPPKREQVENCLYRRYTSECTVYDYFTTEEINRIMRTIPDEEMENDSVAFANQLLVHLGRNADCKPEVVVNLCNVLAMTSANKKLLEPEGYQETVKVLVRALVDYLYEKNYCAAG